MCCGSDTNSRDPEWPQKDTASGQNLEGHTALQQVGTGNRFKYKRGQKSGINGSQPRLHIKITIEAFKTDRCLDPVTRDSDATDLHREPNTGIY